MSPVSNAPTIITCNINQYKCNFELDSGAQLSTISEADAVRCHAIVTPSVKCIRAYNGGVVPISGETELMFAFNNRSFLHKFIVVTDNNVNLMGRDLFHKLNITINVPDCTIHNVSDVVLTEFKDYLSPNFKSCVQQTVSLKVLPEVIPKFCKPRNVPIKLRDKVKTELDRLVDNDILTKVFSSEYASPIVVAFKKTGDLRICGDFSVSLNQFLDPVQSSLPTVDEVLSRVGNVNVFFTDRFGKCISPTPT